ncbi:hypothetical protein ACQKWADRAFT_280950 [Trichoderma austrokoningii]
MQSVASRLARHPDGLRLGAVYLLPGTAAAACMRWPPLSISVTATGQRRRVVLSQAPSSVLAETKDSTRPDSAKLLGT